MKEPQLLYHKDDVDDMLKARTAGAIAGTTVFWVVIGIAFICFFL